jgi:copper chaperone CopZ
LVASGMLTSLFVLRSLQTVVLRVSIHCHGCKKKVRKVLKSVEGVQNVTVDAAQHKVTVTGTVDANTLVQRLHKSGKKGVPWQCHPPANKTEAAPAPAPAPEALPAPPAQPAGEGGKDDAAKAADKKPKEAVKEPQAESAEKKQPEQEAAGTEKKAEAEPKAEEKVEAKKDGGDSEAAEPKAKGAEPAKEESKEAAAAAAGAKNE